MTSRLDKLRRNYGSEILSTVRPFGSNELPISQGPVMMFKTLVENKELAINLLHALASTKIIRNEIQVLNTETGMRIDRGINFYIKLHDLRFNYPYFYVKYEILSNLNDISYNNALLERVLTLSSSTKQFEGLESQEEGALRLDQMRKAGTSIKDTSYRDQFETLERLADSIKYPPFFSDGSSAIAVTKVDETLPTKADESANYDEYIQQIVKFSKDLISKDDLLFVNSSIFNRYFLEEYDDKEIEYLFFNMEYMVSKSKFIATATKLGVKASSYDIEPVGGKKGSYKVDFK